MASERIITFTTDFGTTDHYVGTMKGVILSINPNAKVVDICNSVQSYDVLDGALTIAHAYRYFPKDTVHLVIVDPGVGSTRRPLLVRTEHSLFVAPDNGVLSFIFDREERVNVRHITADHYFLRPVSQTFHGRDIFAAVAGHLSKGVEVSSFGNEIDDYVRFAVPRPKAVSDRALAGIIIKVDKFGNLISNITPNDLPMLFSDNPPSFRITIGNLEIGKLRTAYAQGAPGEVFAVLGSMGFLEIATNRGSAAKAIAADKGSEINIQIGGAQAGGGS